MDSLLALDGAELYVRFAVWLCGADEASVAEFWDGYRSSNARDYETSLLVFLRWTMLDADAALTAVTPDDQHEVWRAWAAHDPEGALAAAIRDGRNEARTSVVASLAVFHPGWLLDRFQNLPEDLQAAARLYLNAHAEHTDPDLLLSFAKTTGDRQMMSATFQSLIAKDPVDAWTWLQQNPGYLFFGGSSDAVNFVFGNVGPSRLRDLERVASSMPAGELRRQVENKRFEILLASDPDAALAEAEATEVPILAADRLSLVGISLLTKDPEKSFGIAETICSRMNGSLEENVRVVYPGGDLNLYGGPQEIYGFFSNLATVDPGRAIDIALRGIDNPADSSLFESLARTWADQDVDAFGRWIEQQAEPRARTPATRVIVSELRKSNRFGEAIEWAARTPGIGAIYQPGHEISPADAEAWLESTDLPLKEGGDR
ncbi:MAG: hypothetical protein H7A49_16490 [Akkermansiaceae bacterium]|nr:hypothetical protein [Akkermansiaceae bacterium]MCP5548211.1 hypothetical protein [Akkermansiaceae bacterium]